MKFNESKKTSRTHNSRRAATGIYLNNRAYIDKNKVQEWS